MWRNLLVLVCVAVVGLGLVSCTKLDTTPQFETRVLDPISLEYGELVAVSSHPTNRRWSALWFRKPDQTITVVWVDVTRGSVESDVTTIPRR